VLRSLRIGRRSGVRVWAKLRARLKLPGDFDSGEDVCAKVDQWRVRWNLPQLGARYAGKVQRRDHENL
jgi:hypothetical protein